MFPDLGQQNGASTPRVPPRLRPRWRMAAVSALLAFGAVGGTVQVEVVEVRIEAGHALLTFNREPTKDWRETFYAVVDTKGFYSIVADGWTHKRERNISVLAFSLLDDTLLVRDVPAEPALLRQLMRAVRGAVEKTNAARPAEDRPRADSSLNGVLEEVFETAPRAEGLPPVTEGR